MNVRPLSRTEIRQVDQTAIETYGIPGIVLMENAGRGAAEVIDQVAPSGPITILAGRGNNGGDGYVIARHLELSGHQVRVLSVVDLDKLQGDAQVNAEIAIRAGITVQVVTDGQQIERCLSGTSTVVDCLLGTGAQGPLRGLYAVAVEIANSQPNVRRIAIDIPTGLDCDRGEANEPTFRADDTITFVAQKLGFQKNNADHYVGVVHVVGIGIPLIMLNQL